MPYIDKESRVRLSKPGSEPATAGELNYLLTLAAISYMQSKGEVRYAHINHVIGSFEMADGRDNLLVDDEHELARELRAIAKRARKAGAITFTDVDGALRCAQIEFYRRVAEPYENIAALKNGDVFPDWLAGGR